MFLFISGIAMSMGILSYKLKLPDPLVGFIAGIFELFSQFVVAFANTGITLYFGE
jgi:hypothetical protein